MFQAHVCAWLLRQLGIERYCPIGAIKAAWLAADVFLFSIHRARAAAHIIVALRWGTSVLTSVAALIQPYLLPIAVVVVSPPRAISEYETDIGLSHSRHWFKIHPILGDDGQGHGWMEVEEHRQSSRTPLAAAVACLAVLMHHALQTGSQPAVVPQPYPQSLLIIGCHIAVAH